MTQTTTTSSDKKEKKRFKVITGEHLCPNCFHRQVYGVDKCKNCKAPLDWSLVAPYVRGEFKG